MPELSILEGEYLTPTDSIKAGRVNKIHSDLNILIYSLYVSHSLGDPVRWEIN